MIVLDYLTSLQSKQSKQFKACVAYVNNNSDQFKAQVQTLYKIVMNYLGSEEIPNTIEDGVAQDLKKYGTLQKFVPLVVFIKNGYFKNDVAK